MNKYMVRLFMVMVILNALLVIASPSFAKNDENSGRGSSKVESENPTPPANTNPDNGTGSGTSSSGSSASVSTTPTPTPNPTVAATTDLAHDEDKKPSEPKENNSNRVDRTQQRPENDNNSPQRTVAESALNIPVSENHSPVKEIQKDNNNGIYSLATAPLSFLKRSIPKNLYQDLSIPKGMDNVLSGVSLLSIVSGAGSIVATRIKRF